MLFGNCVPGTVLCAPYLDVMGGEEDWMPGGRWSPKSDQGLFASRASCVAPSPFCLLQYAGPRRRARERYVRRCLFYGVFPGNQSSSAKTGKWYWNNPVARRA